MAPFPPYVLSFLLASLAGISTTLGAFVAFLMRNRKTRFCYLCVAFGFSAGIMLFVSFAELLNKGIEDTNALVATLGFFGGASLISITDALIPHTYQEEDHENEKEKLEKTAVFLSLGIAIHNFPEGIAVMFASISNPRLGILIALAIALHNIPEGIAVSLPVFYSTKSVKKAFWYSFLSGVAEPLGAVLGFLFLYPFLTDFILGVILSAVAGIMVFISFDELLPYVYKHKETHKHQHLSLLGLFLGMFVIALSMAVS